MAINIKGTIITGGASAPENNGSTGGGSTPSAAPFTNTLVTSITNPSTDTIANPYMGAGLATNGNYIAVGHMGNTTAINATDYPREVHLLNATTYEEITTVTNTAGSFGMAVDVSDDYLVVGAPGYSSGQGRVFVYNHAGTQLYVLDDPAPVNASDYFGASVSIAGNLLYVGAYYHDEIGNNAGNAFVYDLTTGLQVRAHTVGEFDYPNAAMAYVGWAIDSANGRTIIGAAGKKEATTTQTYAGAIMVVNDATGEKLFEIENPNVDGSAGSDRFGTAVAISPSGKYAVAGAPYESDGALGSSGAAYIIDVDTGTVLHSLVNANAYDTTQYDQFGRSVAINDSYTFVAALYEDSSVANSVGTVYVFENTTGNLVATILDETPQSAEYFGNGLAASNTELYVGASKENGNRGVIRVYN